jgi:hypothetical protein
MKTRKHLVFPALVAVSLLLSACGGAMAPAATEAPAFVMGEPAFESSAPSFGADIFAEAPAMQAAGGGSDAVAKEGESAPALPAGAVYNIGASPEEAAFAASHMIIKNADVKLLVEDTELAIQGTTQIVGDVGGYIISSRVWYQPWQDGENYKYATITLGVPVDQFERTLNRLRGLAERVLDETASGEDVTDQYVDLQSQLTNLEATRERIKSFLDDARSVDEALRINQELANVEAQIEEIRGRMNYLKDRAAFSTITVNFEPVLPELEPTPTPTPNAWNPGETFEDATRSVTRAYQGIVDFLIWVMIVFVPIFGPPALLIFGIWKLLTRSPGKPSRKS